MSPKFKIGDKVIWSNVDNDKIMDYTEMENRQATIISIDTDTRSKHKITICFDHLPNNDFWCSKKELKFANSNIIREKLGIK